MNSPEHFEDTFIRIDLQTRRYKTLHRWLGIPVSDGWKLLPDLDHVAITKVNMRQTFHSARIIGNSSTLSYKNFAVFVMGKRKGQRIEAGKYEDAEHAVELATRLSEFLKIPVKNYINTPEG